jgi:hypothetical protein
MTTRPRKTGPTAAEIASLAGSSAAATRANIEQWVEAQMGLAMTSHREYYRKRTNPRLPAPLSGPGPPGRLSALKVKFAGLTQNSQVDPAV